jgi:hypothetical protein
MMMMMMMMMMVMMMMTTTTTRTMQLSSHPPPPKNRASLSLSHMVSVETYTYISIFIYIDCIQMHWHNTMAGYCTKPYSDYCNKLKDFLTSNLQWVKGQIEENKKSSDPCPFWHQVWAVQVKNLSAMLSR